MRSRRGGARTTGVRPRASTAGTTLRRRSQTQVRQTRFVFLFAIEKREKGQKSAETTFLQVS